MINVPADVFQHWNQLIEAEVVATEINCSYKFIIGGEAGGTWMIDLRTGSKVNAETVIGCEVFVEDSDFVRVANGTLNPQIAFLNGQLDITGDLSCALRLGQLIQQLIANS